MKTNFGKHILIALVLLLTSPLQFATAQDAATGDTENLAFKILQKQAAEYELQLSEVLSKSIARYIPEDRYHLTVRIFWNPNKIKQLRSQNKELRSKTGKLPGFPVYVKQPEMGIDYYLGAGSVMKLKIEILIDEKLPKEYSNFIYEMVPIQARFVPERGDQVRVRAIPFPKAKKRPLPLEQDVPLTSDEASIALIDAIKAGQKELDELEPVIVHPVLRKYISDYERYVQEKLNQLLSEYIEPQNFLLNVKFFWNPDEITKLKGVVKKADIDGKVKLPGFNVYIEERQSLYDTITNSMTLLRMEVSVMLDESVNPEVEPFLNKLIPMSVKLIPRRGDKLIVYRGHFPRLKAQLNAIVSKTNDKNLQSDSEFDREINQAFDNGEYRRGIVLVDLLLSRTTNAMMRVPLLKRKGTLHLLLQEKELAKATWEQVRRINPEDQETIRLLEYLK